MKARPGGPTPEGVSNGAPAVERKGAQPPPPTGILDWAPNNSVPLPNERPSEHVRNGLQMLAELESLLLASGDYTQDRRALMADTKRRLGWALRSLAPHAL